jgi:hypothetical protein
MTETKKISIRDRMQNKALSAFEEIESEIDNWLETPYGSDFNTLKHLKRLDYSPKVITFMKGQVDDIIFEVRNEEGCEQLEEAYDFLNKTNKKKFLKFLESIDKGIEEYIATTVVVRKPKIKTPKQLVKSLPFLKQHGKYRSIDPEEIIRAKTLFTYNIASQKFTKFETYGGLSVKGSRIIDYDVCEEKTLTDIKLLDRIYKGGNIIARGFLDEIPRSKLKDGNDLLTKNTLLIKVIR